MADDDIEYPSEANSVTDNAEKVTYSIKLISPRNQSGFELKPWHNTTKFTDVARLRSQIKADFGAHFDDDDNFQIGYIMPGHGAKGRQVPLVYSDDLTCMYHKCKRTKHVVLWVKSLRRRDLSLGATSSSARKRDRQQGDCGPAAAKKTRVGGSSLQQSDGTGHSHSDKSDAGSTRSNYTGVHNKMMELEEIVDELEKRHSKKYTIEQLRAWGNMMLMKKHDSYDQPPDKPFFNVKKGEQSSTRSPGKRIHYRSECMDQLDKWHSLLQRGVVTQEQYSEMQQSILADIKKLDN